VGDDSSIAGNIGCMAQALSDWVPAITDAATSSPELPRRLAIYPAQFEASMRDRQRAR
jgi:hypothetical protein